MANQFQQVYDWNALHAERIKEPKVTLQNWCKARDLNYSYASKQFARIERDLEELASARTKKTLILSGPLAAKTVTALLKSDDEKIRKDVGFGVLDRIGFSPQATLVQITNTNAVQVNTVPFLSQSDNSDLKALLEG